MKIKCRLNHNSGVSAPVVMGHVGRKHNGELHQSGYFSVTAPGGLVDYLFESVFRYGVSVGVARGEHMAYQLLRARRMILHQVMPDDVAVAGERLARPLVHIEDAAVGVANSHGTLNLVGPAAQEKAPAKIFAFCLADRMIILQPQREPRQRQQLCRKQRLR